MFGPETYVQEGRWGGGKTWEDIAMLEATRNHLTGTAATHGAALRDHIRNGRNRATDGELLRRGMKAVDAGSRDSNHNLTIDLQGFPRGTKTALKTQGLFKEVKLNRGRPMAIASETD